MDHLYRMMDTGWIYLKNNFAFCTHEIIFFINSLFSFCSIFISKHTDKIDRFHVTVSLWNRIPKRKWVQLLLATKNKKKNKKESNYLSSPYLLSLFTSLYQLIVRYSLECRNKFSACSTVVFYRSFLNFTFHISSFRLIYQYYSNSLFLIQNGLYDVSYFLIMSSHGSISLLISPA